MRLRHLLSVLVLMCSAAMSVVAVAQTGSAQSALESARKTAVIDGDLPAAIKQYRAIVDRYGKTDRAAAAQALLLMAEAYQKQGNAEARRVYQQIVTEYGDQAAALASAQSALMGLSGGGSQALSVRKIAWELPDLSDAFISSDGRWISTANQSRGELVLHDMTTGAVRILASQPVDPRNKALTKILDPVRSPDGKRVAYALHTVIADEDRGTFELRVIAADDKGEPVTLLRTGSGIVEIWPWAWSPDGRSILTEVFRRNGTCELMWVSATDGTPTRIKSLEWRRQRPRSRMRVSLSPDGRHVAYAALVKNPSSEESASNSAEQAEKHVYVLASDGSGEEMEVTSVPGRSEMPVWTADGSHLLMISGDALFAVPMAAGKESGKAFVVKQGLASAEPLGITLSGSYYYRDTPARVQWLTIRDANPSGAARPGTQDQKNFGLDGFNPAWSPTGASIAYMRRTRAKEPETLVVRSVDSGDEKSFRGLVFAGWFHDGKQVLVKDGTAETGSLFMVPLPFARLQVETGELTRLSLPPMISRGVLSRDEKRIYAQGGLKVEAFDIGTGQRTDVYRATVTPEILALSPDGGSLAVKADNAVVQVGVDGSGARVVATLPKSVTGLAWSGDGRAILATMFTYPLDSPVLRIDVASGAVEPTGRSGSMYVFSQSSMSPDGSRVVMQVSEGGAAKPELFAIDNVSTFLKAKK